MYKKITIAIIIASLFSSCATWDGKQKRTRGDVTRQKEVLRPQTAHYAAINTPARRASMDMVYKGKAQLEREKYDKALGLFREAVIIDSNNGVAYYYMAKARFYLGQYDQAIGILDKADALLQGSNDWEEATQLLREQITSAAKTNEMWINQ